LGPEIPGALEIPVANPGELDQSLELYVFWRTEVLPLCRASTEGRRTLLGSIPRPSKTGASPLLGLKLQIATTATISAVNVHMNLPSNIVLFMSKKEKKYYFRRSESK